MAIKDWFIAELKLESDSTKKMLERVPLDKQDWKPHEKSMPVGHLATHLAETQHWITDILAADEFDFAKANFKPTVASSTEELLSIFQDTFDKAIASLENASDEDFKKIWTVKNGDTVMFQIPKNVSIRRWAFSHMIHHRGQLSVYLRLLDVPVPGMYGPTADESFM